MLSNKDLQEYRNIPLCILIKILCIVQLRADKFLWPIFVSLVILLILCKAGLVKIVSALFVSVMYAFLYGMYVKTHNGDFLTYIGYTDLKDVEDMNESWIKDNAVEHKNEKNNNEIAASEKIISMPEKILYIEKDTGDKNEQVLIDTKAIQEVNIGDQFISEDKMNDNEQDIKITECKSDTTIINEQKNEAQIIDIKAVTSFQNEQSQETICEIVPKISKTTDVKPSVINYPDNAVIPKENNKEDIIINENPPPPNVPNDESIIAENQDQLQLADAIKRPPDYLTVWHWGRYRRHIHQPFVYHFFYFAIDRDVVRAIQDFQTTGEIFSFELEDNKGKFTVNVAKECEVIGKHPGYRFYELVLRYNVCHIVAEWNNTPKLFGRGEVAAHIKYRRHHEFINFSGSAEYRKTHNMKETLLICREKLILKYE